MGRTGAGKSTFINHLQKKKMIKQYIGQQNNIEVIDAVDSEPNIKIGHKQKAETLFLNSVVCNHNRIYLIVDSPGFFDKRDKETAISNSINITEGLQMCDTVNLVLLINYHELEVGRSGAIKETL